MRLKQRLLRLEKARPVLPLTPAPADIIDWAGVTEALLAGIGSARLDAPSARALADLTPYAGVVRAFLAETAGPWGPA